MLRTGRPNEDRNTRNLRYLNPPVVLTAPSLHSPLIHGAQKSTIQTASSSSLRKNHPRPYAPRPRRFPPTNLARPHQPPQRLCLSGNPRVPDPRPRARDLTRAISRCDRHRHRRGELYGLRRHERHRAHASAIHRRASHRPSLSSPFLPPSVLTPTPTPTPIRINGNTSPSARSTTSWSTSTR